MSRAKEALRAKYGHITPEFVDRELGAYLAAVSPETWDHYVAIGRIPPPEPGFPESTPRWFWPAVRSKLRGSRDDAAPGIDRAALRAGNVADGPSTSRGH